MIAGESRAALLAALVAPAARRPARARLPLPARADGGRDRRRARRPAGHGQVAHVPRPGAPARGGDAVNELESALRELEVDWPATPDLATAVSDADRGGGAADRAAPAVGRAPWRRARSPFARGAGWRARLAYVAAALVLLAGGTLAASPEARSTVLRWLGLKSVEIRREPPRPGGRPRARPRHADRAAPRQRPRPGGARRRPTRSTRRRCPTARTPSRSSTPARRSVLVQTFRAHRDAVHPEVRRLRPTPSSGSTSTARAPTGSPARTASPTSRPTRLGYEDQRLAGPHAARRARRAAAPGRGRDQPRPRRRDRRPLGRSS